ncbi:hypothetical protein MTR67_023048 [Solanum verrucosum]|uniref:Uncharacterized protein n=1 Tax=Solanum verrucosum TaxID=315347 RepID=A0AAF0TYD3_SOLVR|nr:hypothetical protein MTR67_023048 [Solanum verrucosum]
MLLQITYHDKATQTETKEKDTIEKIFKVITTLCTKVDSMDNEIQKLKTDEDNLKSKASQQHDYKNAELRRSEDGKNPELKGDDGKLLKTHNVCLNTATGTSKQVSDKQHKNAYLNQLFAKPFTQTTPIHVSIEPQTSTYADSLQNQNEKKTYNYIKRTSPTDILYEEIKPPIQVIKIGLTKDMIIPKDIGQQEEICKIEIPSFYANKLIIGVSTIIQGLANNYLNGNVIWNYYARDQLMIYSNSRELRKADMDEVQRWILSLLKPEERPTTRALNEGFISVELLTRYCKLIGHKCPDHICSKCNGEDNIIPDVQLE